MQETLTAKQVKRIRKKLKLGQANFARRLGLTQSIVSRWESGNRECSGTAAKLIQLLLEKPSAVK